MAAAVVSACQTSSGGTPVVAWVRPTGRRLTPTAATRPSGDSPLALHPGKAFMSHRETITVRCASFVLMSATLRTQRHRHMVHFYDKFPDQFRGQTKIVIYRAGTLTRSRAWHSEHATWRCGFVGQTV
ncbi:hypothetical protein SSPO_006370 [Streptomyces antimycoticus]|uniref:Uncharacterized protein n=1 Tax=Streptomyces antimycoticus TaxID=68175 RepID=A0A499ULB4_9ACTN|nr:hypothetical protein SSPO_006370 [Streptomyces antimycoticus]